MALNLIASRRLVALACICFVSLQARSSMSSPVGYLLVAERPGPLPAVHLVVPAEFVAMTLEVTSFERDNDAKKAEVRAATALIHDAVRNEPGLSVRHGRMASRGGKGGLSVWHELHLFAAIKEGADGPQAADGLRAFVQAIELPGKARADLGGWRLAIADRAELRTQLLADIALDAGRAREVLRASGDARLSGLESALRVLPLDDVRVQVFLDYRLELVLRSQDPQ